ncbi:hypothetical protein C7212DRAFT_359168 [Tuber magnatum]|uniref:Uncharacterized protein n=1 Tax=Tuber magnatum TaxID=42249 RepID=A0A317SH70_9PEZI|nr:hypothetical protein C7212DRAFT_359168 [Tuber magnatum]
MHCPSYRAFSSWRDMAQLYHELWGKAGTIQVVTDFSLRVPQPTGFVPGYGMKLLQGVDSNPNPLNFIVPGVETNFKQLVIRNLLPCGESVPLVRDEYIELEQTLLRKVSEKWENESQNGKSIFLSYLLVQRLLKGQPTVYRESDRNCFLFDEDYRGNHVDADTLIGLSTEKKRKLWILTDEALSDPAWNRRSSEWFVILSASPEKIKCSNQRRKDRAVGARYMRNWTWEEIFAGFSLQGWEITPQQIQRLYTTFSYLGPVARTCLESVPAHDNATYTEYMKEYLREVQPACRTFITFRGHPGPEELMASLSSYKLVIMEPTQGGSAYTSRIATRWIAHKIAEMGERLQQLNPYGLYQSLCTQPPLRTAAGWFFERYAHDWFRAGGQFHALELKSSGRAPSHINFKTKISRSNVINYFTTPENLANQVIVDGRKIGPHAVRKYFLPYSRTQESFDGIAFTDTSTVLLLQFTIARRHGVIVHGIRDLLRSLPRTVTHLNIVFVTPEHRQQDFVGPQNIPTAGDLGCPAGELSIRQFRLVFPNERIRFVATNNLVSSDDDDDIIITDMEAPGPSGQGYEWEQAHPATDDAEGPARVDAEMIY